jgi:hypothetical protein
MKTTMTQTKIAAHQTNGKLSNGPSTAPDRERIRTTRDEPSRETPPGTHDVYEKRAS